MPSLKEVNLTLDEVKLILKSCGVDANKIDSFLPKGDETDILVEQRCDFVRKKIGSIKRTDEGYLTGNAAIAKVGVMTYYIGDGKVRKEYLPPETLFSSIAMDSLKLKPMTNSHPEKMLDARSAKIEKIGFTGETVSKSDDYLTTSLTITDQDAIDHVDQGRKQLSPGYTCQLLMQPGEISGIKYDAIQIGRKYNHVAICDAARGGPDLTLNFDSLEGSNTTVVNQLTTQPNPQRRERVMPYVIDGIQYDASQEVVNHISKLNGKIDELNAAITKAGTDSTVAKADLDKITGERDQLKTKADELEKRDIRKDVAERVAVEAIARKVIDAKDIEESLKLDNAELRKKVVLTKHPDVKLDDKSAEYIGARFDTIAETVAVDKGDETAIARQRQAAASRSDSTGADPVVKAKKDMVDRMTNSWKPGEDKK